MRPPIIVTNRDKTGKVTDGSWHIRVGNKWRTFTEANYKDGLRWINAQIRKAR